MSPGLIFGSLNSTASAALIALLLIVAAGTWGWHKGAESVRAEWETERRELAIKAAEVKAAQAEAGTRAVTRYVDRVRTVREPAETLIKEIPVHVPSDTCALPAGFRVLHDTAARGFHPPAAGAADATPVAAQDLASTIALNYADCQQNAEQLSALQSWAADVSNAESGSSSCADSSCGGGE